MILADRNGEHAVLKANIGYKNKQFLNLFYNKVDRWEIFDFQFRLC